MFRRFLRIIVICLLGLVGHAASVSAETKVVVGSSSYIFHNDAFENLVSTFVGSYSPSNQLIWNSISIDSTSISEGGSVAASTVAFYPISSVQIGSVREFDDVLKSGLDFETKTSVNATTYYFPDGIPPVIDPLYLDIVSLDIEAYLAKSLPLASFEGVALSSDIGAGLHASALSSHLEWVFWDARDSIFVVEPFARAGLEIATKNASVELTATVTQAGNSQFQLSSRFTF